MADIEPQNNENKIPSAPLDNDLKETSSSSPAFNKTLLEPQNNTFKKNQEILLSSFATKKDKPPAQINDRKMVLEPQYNTSKRNQEMQMTNFRKNSNMEDAVFYTIEENKQKDISKLKKKINLSFWLLGMSTLIFVTISAVHLLIWYFKSYEGKIYESNDFFFSVAHIKTIPI